MKRVEIGLGIVFFFWKKGVEGRERGELCGILFSWGDEGVVLGFFYYFLGGDTDTYATTDVFFLFFLFSFFFLNLQKKKRPRR